LATLLQSRQSVHQESSPLQGFGEADRNGFSLTDDIPKIGFAHKRIRQR